MAGRGHHRSRRDDPAGSGSRTVEDEFLAVAPKAHPLGRQGRIGLAELVRAGVAYPGGTCGPALAEGAAAHGVDRRPGHVVRDVGTAVAMAAAGIAAGVAPPWHCRIRCRPQWRSCRLSRG
ncbi:LysR substrate-binding domain-containing protein [Amycolatopsis ultiminotia]|uniref:LysR substrate-binding domain-containing protein n=1 Tax=Amycolatopsis ultiminotia TaxID=543629 RepID=UPI003CD052C6